MNHSTFSFGNWRVAKASNSVYQGDTRHQLEPKVMDVLLALCERPGAVLSPEELLMKCWGSTLHGDNPIHKTITHLRRVLGDSATTPTYIETIRKRGYRVIAPVSFDEQLGAWLDGSPFRGLEAFDARHAAVFFGRDEASGRLADAVLAQARRGHALVIVLGPSGSGKTSLIQAGLMPKLNKGWEGMACVSSTSLDLGLPAPGRLFIELGGAMLDWQAGPVPAFDGESADSLGRILESRPQDLSTRLAALGLAPGQRLVLILDRFEALFALPSVSEEERAALVRAVDVLAASAQLIVVAACRNDFYPRIADYPALMQGKAHGAHVDLSRPTSAEIARMIRLPAQAAQLRFGVDAQSGARLDDVLCQSVTGSPDALPLLQYTLQEMYRKRNPDGELTFEAFNSLGGVAGAIGQRAEEVLAALEVGPRGALPGVLSLIVTLSSASDSVTSRSARWADLRNEDERALVTALVEARLLVSELVGTMAGFRVAHEALLRRWPRATEWITTHRNSLLIRARIGALAGRWVEGGKPVDLLLPAGQQLDEARAMVLRGDLALSADEVALVGVSAGRAQRLARIRLAAMTLILCLAVLASGLGVAALGARNVAEQRRVDAEGLVHFMLGELAEKLRPLGRLDLLDGVSTKALRFLSRDNTGQFGPNGVLQRAKALHVIGEVRIARGDSGAATTAFTSARSLLEPQLMARPRDSVLLTILGANAYWLGLIQLDKNELKGAREHFLRYRDLTDRLYAVDPGNVNTWIELSYAHNNLGTLALRTGDLQTAAHEFMVSISLKSRALANKHDDRALTAELADSLSWLGEIRLKEGQIQEALALYQRELALTESLETSVPGDALMTHRRGEALQHRAMALLALGNDTPAMQDLAVAEQIIAKNLVLEPGNKAWQRALAFVQMERLRVRSYGTLSNADVAELADIERRTSGLVRLDPENDAWAKLGATARTRYGMALSGVSRFEAAAAMFAQAGATLGAHVARDRADWRSTVAFAVNQLGQARLKELTSDHEGQLLHCAAARDVLRATALESKDFKVLDPWVRANWCLGQPEIAKAAMDRLSVMGYRDVAYMQYLTNRK